MSENGPSHGFFDRLNINKQHSGDSRIADTQREWYTHDIPVESLHLETEAIRLKNLQIGWNRLPTLAKSINQLKEDPIETSFNLSDLKPSGRETLAVPMIASVVAHENNPTIPMNLPTAEEVKMIKPWLRRVSTFVGRFSTGLSHKFDRVIEKKGRQTVQKTGEKIYETAQALGNAENPQERFVLEVTQLYTRLTEPETYFDFEEKDRTIEAKISQLIKQMNRASNEKSFKSDWFTKDNFPLLANVSSIVGFPPSSVYVESDTIGIAGAEMMQGIAVFLRQSGINNIPNAPQPTEFDLFNPASWRRGLAEWFKADQLEKVKNELPQILSHVHKILPQNGPKFERDVYGIAKNVVVLKAKGKTDNELINGLFAA